MDSSRLFQKNPKTSSVKKPTSAVSQRLVKAERPVSLNVDGRAVHYQGLSLIDDAKQQLSPLFPAQEKATSCSIENIECRPTKRLFKREVDSPTKSLQHMREENGFWTSWTLSMCFLDILLKNKEDRQIVFSLHELRFVSWDIVL